MERETLKLALDALGKAKRQIVHAKVAPHECIGDAITAIKEALAQPAQEPVAVLFQDGSIVKLEDLEFVPEKSGQRIQMLCTAPQQRPWLKPTDNEWFEWWRVSKVADETEAEIDFADFLIIAQAVVAKLKEKNNGT